MLWKLEKTINSNEESVTYKVTGKTLGTTYTYKVKVYETYLIRFPANVLSSERNKKRGI